MPKPRSQAMSRFCDDGRSARPGIPAWSRKALEVALEQRKGQALRCGLLPEEQRHHKHDSKRPEDGHVGEAVTSAEY